MIKWNFMSINDWPSCRLTLFTNLRIHLLSSSTIGFSFFQLGGQLPYSEILAALCSLNMPKVQFVLLIVSVSVKPLVISAISFSVEVNPNLSEGFLWPVFFFSWSQNLWSARLPWYKLVITPFLHLRYWYTLNDIHNWISFCVYTRWHPRRSVITITTTLWTRQYHLSKYNNFW